MPQAVGYAFAYHQLLVMISGSVCLFGTWVGMRHFARARRMFSAWRWSARYCWSWVRVSRPTSST